MVALTIASQCVKFCLSFLVTTLVEVLLCDVSSLTARDEDRNEVYQEKSAMIPGEHNRLM